MTERSAFRVVSSGVAPEEIAAASVVLESALEQLGVDDERNPSTSPSRWARSQIGLRETIVAGDRRWGSPLR